MAEYFLHEGAREDLDEIWMYLAQAAGPDIATKIEGEFFDAFSLPATQPRIGFQQPELTSRPLRFWPPHRYLIAYVPEQRPVLILAVIHGPRHPRAISRILARRH